MCIASTTEIRFTESHETRGNRKASAIAQHKPHWSAKTQKVVRQRQDKAGQPKDSRPCEGSNPSWLLQQAPKPQRDTVTKEEWQQLMLERRQERWDHWQAHAVRSGLQPRPEHERPTAAKQQSQQQSSSSADCDAGSHNRRRRSTQQVPADGCRSRRPATKSKFSGKKFMAGLRAWRVKQGVLNKEIARVEGEKQQQQQRQRLAQLAEEQAEAEMRAEAEEAKRAAKAEHLNLLRQDMEDYVRQHPPAKGAPTLADFVLAREPSVCSSRTLEGFLADNRSEYEPLWESLWWQRASKELEASVHNTSQALVSMFSQVVFSTVGS